MNEVYAWHLVPKSGYLRYDLSHIKIYKGLKLSVNPNHVVMYLSGLFGSSELNEYHSEFIVCRVKLTGKILSRQVGTNIVYCAETREIIDIL